MQGMGTVLSNKTHNEAFHCDKLTSVLDNSNPPLESMGESVLPKDYCATSERRYTVVYKS